jgi:hypothetical protein
MCARTWADAEAQGAIVLLRHSARLWAQCCRRDKAIVPGKLPCVERNAQAIRMNDRAACNHSAWVLIGHAARAF